MYRSYGGWTFAFSDYMDLNVTANLDSPYTQGIADIVDPYSQLEPSLCHTLDYYTLLYRLH